MISRRVVPLLATAGVLAAGATAQASVIRGSAGASRRAFVQRAAALPAGASVTGSVAASAPVQLTVALTPSDPQALASYAQQVSDPSSPLYRHYLSVSQFAARFGAGAAEVASVRTALTQAGVSVGAVASNGLSVSASGTAAAIEGAFQTQLQRVTLPDGSSAYADVANPTLPAAAAKAVQSVAGLDTLPAAAPQDVVRPSHARGHVGTTTNAAGPSSCSGENLAGGYTAAQIGSAYGLDTQWNAGNLGAGSTVALVELEPYSASDVATFQTCDRTSPTVVNVKVDRGASCNGDAQCGLEDVLDIEDVAGLAPAATIRVYEAPNSDQGLLDAYQQIVSSNAPVVSTSWGLCEAQSDPSTLASENALFEEAAVQGESVFAAAGDSGADDCQTGTQAVDDPASQPYVTGVGGTTMPSDAAGAPQSVWNDAGAGGGGVSRVWPMPSYQSPFAIAQSGIHCPAVAGGAVSSTSCREVPDVSANADPNTGYDVLYNGGWIAVGGTSAAAPTWASLVALADSSSVCTANDVHVGFANEVLYGLPASDFNDVTTGDNSYAGVAGYRAATGYDMASGLGTPNGAALIPALCNSAALTATPPTTTTTTAVSTTSTPPAQTTPPVQTTTPPVQTTATPVKTITPTSSTPGRTAPVVRFLVHRRRRMARVGHRVRVVLRAHNLAGLRLRYSARRLPRGLRINRRTGVISGRPRRAGRCVSSITARDRRGDAETIVIRWTIRRR